MKTVLITGASRGIGAACARAFAEAGYRVAINYNNSEKQAKELKAELEEKYTAEVLAIKADVGIKAQAEAMVNETLNSFKEIDVLINNAGISLYKLFTETEEDEWNRVISTNLSSVYFCSKAILPSMIRRKSGCIMNIASMWGEVGASCEVAYSASKAGVIGLTKALAKELAPSGIRVNAISPGVIATDMMSGFDDDAVNALKEEIPLGEIGRAEDIAKAALFLASSDADYITGQILSVNGGMVI